MKFLHVKLIAHVTTDRHAVGTISVFGKDRVTIELVGNFNGQDVRLVGRALDAPGTRFFATLKRVA